MTATIRIATVGTGFFARFHHEAWARMDDVALVGVASLDKTSATEFAKTFSIPEIFTDAAAMLDEVKPDLLDIAAPPDAHLELISEAAKRDIAVICQKPFCGTLDQARKAVALAEDAGILLVVHENFRWQPWYGEIKSQLDSGALGTLYQASFRLRPGDGQGPNAYLDRQPYFQKMERFLVHETLIHLIDVFRFLLGEPTRIFAALRQLNPAIAGEDAGIILMDFAHPTRGLIDGNRLADHAAENRRLVMGEMLLEGSQATLSLSGDGRLFIRPSGENSRQEISYAWEDRAYAGDCVYRFQRHVVEHLRGHGPVCNTGADYLANIMIEEAAYASSERGRWVDITGPFA